ncbi:hypothetical protein B0T25DRAFT_510106 [Lasiosphaeria hispida]|uniref:R3H domain-containing protein n=1 Tax=Lasiosphaeria hispida TaxID=260671 RepID=A0AAJ0M8A2_9PEZI|nr:hypothetical protein B0T25DRAFT_510106 [Lasiosphaeria hispida]
MSETPIPPTNPRGFRRGRGGRGQSRGGRHRGSERPSGAGEGSQPSQTEDAMSQSRPAFEASSEVSADVTTETERGGRRGLRRGRGAASGQRSVIVSHRARSGPRTTPGPVPSNSLGLSVDAPEFVPGQPIASSSAGPRIAVAKPKPSARRMSKSSASDLSTRIHEDILNGQYECVICTNEVVRTSRIWSCSVCWTVTHLHCVKKWHTNQTKKKEEDHNPNPVPGWRCPGCNSSLSEDPGPHHCWCGKELDAKPIAGLPPHTCGQTCSKPRATCPHPCPLMCHAGPCPPCTLMAPTQTCHCGKHMVTKRCVESEYGKGWSCQDMCGDLLPCGEHTCSRPCHSGLCGACEIPMLSTCYCGGEQREIPCDQRDDILESFRYRQHRSPETSDDTTVDTDSDFDPWFEGSFQCGKECGRNFDCGHHTCQKPCHPQDEAPAHCPFSPDLITHCPCGKTPLQLISTESRQSCQDPIPHCDKPCNKVLACGHLCQNKCHIGSCAPCPQDIDITCRCGRTAVNSVCHQGNIEHPLCFRICRAQLNCGRHECGEHCCTGEKKAAERRKQKRNASDNYEAEHICLQVCGRQLKCGRHVCQQLCHKGPCQSCLEAVFDEISCSCGRTVLQPPQPCGTKPPECRYECTKARPCGHPTVSHTCHPEETPCPKCPFLVEKLCICGKKVLKNQPCWFGETRCGLPCGKKLKCGTHLCRELCHKTGQCEDAGISGSHCPQPCGKVRKSCEHSCADQCHAPYPCKEDKPCEFKTFITCSCQNRKQEVRCLATKLSPWPGRETTLKCDDECLRLQRNRRLADALKIDPETHTDDFVPYSDVTLRLFRENVTWAQAQEREFRVFASAADEKRLRFKPMPPHQRAFLHALATDFGLDSESEDPAPHRHVCIFKTPRFVSAPQKTLAQCLRIAQTAASIGAAAPAVKQPTIFADRQQQTSQAFNAFLLKDPRFGLTVEDVDQALAADLLAVARSGPALKFTANFLLSDEIVIKATPVTTAAAIATASLSATPQAVEAALTAVKPALAKTVSLLNLATSVTLCHADSSLNIVRKEGDAGSAGGWNAVASRRRTAQAGGVTVPPGPAPRSFLTLRKVDLKKKQREKERELLAAPVEDDWLTAAEQLEEDEDIVEKRGSGAVGTSTEDHAAISSGDDGVGSGS